MVNSRQLARSAKKASKPSGHLSKGNHVKTLVINALHFDMYADGVHRGRVSVFALNPFIIHC